MVSAFLKRKFLSHVSLYLFFSFFNKGISFLLLPFYARYLTQQEYGAYALFLTVVLAVDPFLTFCVHDAVTYVYFHSCFKINVYVGTFVTFCFSLFLIQESVFFLLTFLSFGGWSIPSFLLLAPLVAMANIFRAVLGWMWQVREQPAQYGIFHFFSTLLKCLCNIGAVGFLGLGWKGLLWAESLYALVFLSAAIIILKRSAWLDWSFDLQYLKFGLRFGVGYMPSVFAFLLNDSVGRLFLAGSVSLADVGVYSMGQKLGSVVALYSSAFTSVYQPWLFRTLAGQKDGHVGQKILQSLIGAVFSVFAFALLCGGSIWSLGSWILGRGFQESMPYVYLSILASVAVGLYSIFTKLIVYTGRTWIISSLTVFAVGANVFLTWSLMRAYGMIGVGYAPFGAWSLTLCITVWAMWIVWRRDIAVNLLKREN